MMQAPDDYCIYTYMPSTTLLLPALAAFETQEPKGCQCVVEEDTLNWKGHLVYLYTQILS